MFVCVCERVKVCERERVASMCVSMYVCEKES